MSATMSYAEFPSRFARIIEKLIGEVYSRSFPIYLIVSGAGTRAVGWLFARPGASKVIIAEAAPFSQPAVDEFFSKPAACYASTETAYEFDPSAYRSVVQLTDSGATNPLGVACVGALKTEPPRRGADRVAIAYCGGESDGAAVEFELDSSWTRARQEERASLHLINALARACGVATRINLDE